ncbi:SDR family oxidoreductase [Pseudomonas aeruginosa]|uniref:SDR family oxidoreductase n=1 Tax=Pseudomonas aeruginosa TaxID=287 RepID=UPI000F8332C4|nr:SDR family oxidoreductase [Pseudomonas aeruginosa]MBH8862583.1 SDR family oxidoreductase [Pseudomonas aeruginosa]MBI7343780.1 SDR family oxidoreductase [Pseudomonas aeruginosa]RTV59050.1 SDR family oxidoreductase [Pseudomonas aeruginosa]TEQ13654.1 SDR family oxidoreductase [Pseudomonas aeruginosa]HDY6079722.1 SDR family oxidoreductase [Pseudomonas aeruginosa]
MSETSKVALITGSSRGIGAALAQRLAGEGFRVIVNYAGSAGPAAAVVASIEAAGGQALALQADVADPMAVGVMFEEVERAFQGIDVVVNCAGVMQLASVADSDDQLFDRTVAINFKGTFNVCREAARRLRDGGRIINFSSSVIGMRSPTYGVYIATKAAVEGLTQVLAQEMRGRGITVNAVAPGPVATALFLDGKSPELIERMSRVAPLERLGEPGDIAEVVAFLAGPQGGWVNGQVVRANGGLC